MINAQFEALGINDQESNVEFHKSVEAPSINSRGLMHLKDVGKINKSLGRA